MLISVGYELACPASMCFELMDFWPWDAFKNLGEIPVQALMETEMFANTDFQCHVLQTLFAEFECQPACVSWRDDPSIKP